jgi:very-short-patch-repair endonuclease
MRVATLERELEDFDALVAQLGHLYDGPTTDWETVLDTRTWVAAVAANDLVGADALDESLLDRDADETAALATHLDEALADWESASNALADVFDLDAVSIDGADIEAAAMPSVESWFTTRRDAVEDLQSWIQYRDARDDVLEGPAGGFLEAYLDDGHPAETLVDTFERNFYTEWLNDVYPETGFDSFSATEYDALLEEFQHLDQQQREYAKAEIQHRVTNRRPQTELQHASSSEQVTLRREVQKSRKHMPLRELFDEVSTLVTTLKPCFMMSPLSVAQYLRHGSIEFDAVIFDEASQIMPQDAISSIIRGEQVIIAGDSKQLPPTSFFQADVETADGVREDLESILDEASTVLPEKRLLWHYRSRTNELIEFSNAKYYDGALRTFPDNNADDAMGVDFVYVEDGLYDRGGSSTNQPEADRVLELVREHLRERPDKSLGVVAFSSAQAQAIRDTIEEARGQDPELDAFVSEDDALEGFFVKPLENVQGDERDALIFSVGYGPDEAGKISMNFGPLNQTGGARRLNVAVTRAKEHIQVVSSLQPGDIDLQRTGRGGVEDFKHYLEYAKHGEDALTRSDSESQFLQFDSEFEEAVYTALESRGLDVSTQVQSSGYSIDLAIRHPDEPGTYVLGIECDGAAYHSSKTARDRDRTRQTVLEDLGWTIHRIWSPDWASNKSREIDAIESKVERLVADSPVPDGGVSTEVSEVTVDAVPEDDRSGIREYTTDWQEPEVQTRRDKSFDDIPARRISTALVSVVDEFGPERRERVFRTVIDRWNIARLGKNIRQELDTVARKRNRRDQVRLHDGFIWPGERPDAISLRTNTEAASRSADSIPLEELARAGHLILEAGTRMTRDDLVLEIARLYGYQRTGSTIKAHIDILVSEDCAELDASDATVEFIDVDADRILLDRIYG